MKGVFVDNVFNRELKPFELKKKETLHSSDLLPNSIKGRHLESNMYAIYFGLSTNRPDGSTHAKAYFSTDTGVLSIWDGSQWLSTTLS